MKTISDLTSTEFENLTYDVLQLAGMRRLIWRTPGADGGRDIEGQISWLDFSGYHVHQTWYVECKRYSASVDWPTVWKKISYAESRGADYLLLVTNNNPSPSCETEINNWNNLKKNVVVRVWRGYEFDRLLDAYPSVASKYGVTESHFVENISQQQIVMEIMKIAQASFAEQEFGHSGGTSLEANAALSELVFARMHQLKVYGKFLVPLPSERPPQYVWLVWSGPTRYWDEMGLRAFLSWFRHVVSAQALRVLASDEGARITAENPKFNLTDTTRKTMAEIALWADIKLNSVADAEIGINV